jgi:hypothetical protein
MIKIPGKRPATSCAATQPTKNAHGWNYPCTRRSGHTGRHAFIHWGLGGIVRAVWGHSHAHCDPHTGNSPK